MNDEPLDELAYAWAVIGRATTNFEQIEFILANIYWILCETENPTAYECYGTILSFRTKTSFLRIACNNYFKRPSKMKSKTMEIIKTSENISKLRNDIVHAGYHPDETNIENPSFYPMPHQTRKWKQGKPKYINSSWDVTLMSGDILLFTFEIKQFYEKLSLYDKKRRQQRALRLNQ